MIILVIEFYTVEIVLESGYIVDRLIKKGSRSVPLNKRYMDICIRWYQTNFFLC